VNCNSNAIDAGLRYGTVCSRSITLAIDQPFHMILFKLNALTTREREARG